MYWRKYFKGDTSSNNPRVSLSLSFRGPLVWLVSFWLCLIGSVIFISTQIKYLYPLNFFINNSLFSSNYYHHSYQQQQQQQQIWNNFMYGVEFTILSNIEYNNNNNNNNNSNNEDNGFYWTSDHSTSNDGLLILKSNMVTAVRLSLFNDPSNTVKYGTVDDVMELAKRIKDRNMQFLLELYFSDTLTNNVTQPKPKAWKTLKEKKLTTTVFQSTKEIIQKLAQIDALPQIVSIGHEIENGILFNEPIEDCIKNSGYIGSSLCRQKNMFYFVSLLKSAINGIRSVSDQPQIMLHTSLANELYMGRNGADTIIKFYSELNEEWKVTFDVIGLTFYPMRAQGCPITKLQELKYIFEYFNRRFPIVIAETGYPYISIPNLNFEPPYECSENGQYLYMRDLLHMCHDRLEGICAGVYWNPAYVDSPDKLEPWQGPIFDMGQKTPLKVLREGFLH